MRQPKIKAGAVATNQIRWVKRKNGLSGNPSYIIVLQQKWERLDGFLSEWRDVPIEKEYPLPDGATNRGRLGGN